MMTKNIVFVFFIAIISLSAYLFFAYSRENQNSIDVDNTALSTPSLSVPSTHPAVLSASTTQDVNGWRSYEDQQMHFSLSFPDGYSYKKTKDVLVIFKKSNSEAIIPLISIKERFLKENETINTISEKDIDEKMKNDKEPVTISETITPIAIGSVTAVTFKLHETNGDNSYFYLPEPNNKFLEISIIGENNLSAEDLSSIDGIVYSLELK